MHNRAAVTSPCWCLLRCLSPLRRWCRRAPLRSPTGHDVQCPDMASGHYSNRLLRARPAGARGDRRAYFADGRGGSGAGGGILGTLYGSLSGYLGGADSQMMRLLEILNFFPFMFFVILLVTFGQNILLIFCHRHGFRAGYGAYRARTDLSLKRKEFIGRRSVGSTASIVLRHRPQRTGVVTVYASLLVPA